MKYMILYKSSKNATDTMADATQEQMEASMAEWMQWKEEAEKTSGFEFGMPLQAVGKVTNEGVTDSNTEVSGYSMMEGDKESILEALKSHPHLKREGASIEVLEFVPMPGM